MSHQIMSHQILKRERPEGTLSRGFSLVGLLAVIAIVSILAAILFPVLAQSREKARQAACLSNQRQINLGMMLYVQDNDGTWPAKTVCANVYTSTQFHSWAYAIQPYIHSAEVWKCPDDRSTVKVSGDYTPANDVAKSYGVVGQYADRLSDGVQAGVGNTAMMVLGGNGNGDATNVTTASTPEPANTIWLVEAGEDIQTSGPLKGKCYDVPCMNMSNKEPRSDLAFYVQDRGRWLPAGDEYNRIAQNHLSGANWGYADGHVRWAHLEQLISYTDPAKDAFIRVKQRN